MKVYQKEKLLKELVYLELLYKIEKSVVLVLLMLLL